MVVVVEAIVAIVELPIKVVNVVSKVNVLNVANAETAEAAEAAAGADVEVEIGLSTTKLRDKSKEEVPAVTDKTVPEERDKTIDVAVIETSNLEVNVGAEVLEEAAKTTITMRDKDGKVKTNARGLPRMVNVKNVATAETVEVEEEAQEEVANKFEREQQIQS
jgi:hypothetical protein